MPLRLLWDLKRKCPHGEVVCFMSAPLQEMMLGEGLNPGNTKIEREGGGNGNLRFQKYIVSLEIAENRVHKSLEGTVSGTSVRGPNSSFPEQTLEFSCLVTLPTVVESLPGSLCSLDPLNTQGRVLCGI